MRIHNYHCLLLLLLCALGTGQLRAQDISANYFQGDTLIELSLSGSAAQATTFTYDTDCQQLGIAVTDPDNAPLPGSNAYVLRLRDSDGNTINDLTDRLTVTMRARSIEEVSVQFLFRSEPGQADFRTAGKTVIIPAGLDEWTEVSVSFEMADFGPSFDPTQLQDLWFYMDRGTANFPGNEFYIDHIVVGGSPDPMQNSPCTLGGGMMNDTISANYFQDETQNTISTTSSAGVVTTFELTDCEELKLSITDPANAPLAPFNAYNVRVRDADNNQFINLTDRVTATLRVRSAEAMQVGILFRSGDGTSDNRTVRLPFEVPAGLEAWTEFTVSFTGDDLAGLDPADIRDMWVYLDPGTENFPGNEFYIDHIVIGGAPDPAQNSPCTLGGGMMSDSIATYYFQEETQNVVSTTSTAGAVTTFVLTECEELQLSITDTLNAPLAPFNAYIVSLRDTAGNRFVDLTDRVTATLRVRSAEAMQVGVLFRSGDGSSDFRTVRIPFEVPAGLDAWTEATVSFTGDDLRGLDPANIRDMWFYLDPGNENFPGNEFYIDHITIGALPDPAQNSPCNLGGMAEQVFVEYFQADTLTSFVTTNSAGRASTFAFDAECETVTISVTDPAGAPLPPFNAYQVNPTDINGADVTNITDNMTITMRVRSAAGVNVSLLFRSGGGTMEERTDRLDVDIPGELEEWTEFTVTFTQAEIGGFDPTDLLDFWFYLDRGEANFAGNLFIIDHITMGTTPDPAQNSTCDLIVEPTNFIAQFDDGNTTVLGGAESDKYTLTATDCEEIKVEVTDPVGAPHQALRPIVINPTDALGTPISNIEGSTDVYIRARGAENIPVSVVFRSGDGSNDFRTAPVTRTVVGDLTRWSNLKFTFSEEELGNFDPTDMIDMWIYLDRENDNFAGNELYIDYIAIGEKPDSLSSSPCGLADIMTGTQEAAWTRGIRLFPNPTSGLLTVDVPALTGNTAQLKVRMLDVTGRAVAAKLTLAGANRLDLDLTALPRGVYFLQLRDSAGGGVMRRVVKQ